jgi:hypothetical protein
MPGMLGEELAERVRDRAELFGGHIILASSAGLKPKTDGERPAGRRGPGQADQGAHAA